MKKKILITSGSGFICSHFIGFFLKKPSDYHVYNLESLTNVSNLENLKYVPSCNYQNYYEKKYNK